MSFINDCLQKFAKLPESTKDFFGNEEALSFIENLEQVYNVDLKLLVVLLAIDELGLGDIADYLKEQDNLEFEKANSIAMKLEKRFFNEADNNLSNDQYFSIAEKKLVEFFQKGILKLLGEDDYYKVAINEEILNFLSMNDNTQASLVEAMLNNEEIITSQEFFYDAKKTIPTVANWLKDFIGKKGIDAIDDLYMSEYLANSANIKNLNVAEKSRVRDVLITFKNIKFFPDEFVELPIERWQFVPLVNDEIINEISKADLNQLPEETENSEIQELEDLSNKFAQDTLERRAVEEEMKKLRAKS